MFLLLGLTEDSTASQLEMIAERYKNLIVKQLEKKCDKIADAINNDTVWVTAAW